MRRGPRSTASMHSAFKDLKLDTLHVVHAGPRSYPMGERIHALALADYIAIVSAAMAVEKVNAAGNA